MRNRQLFLNTSTSILQVLVLTGVYLVLYRFLLHSIGVELLGVWSLVLSTTSVATISELGLSGSTVKFVARYCARGEQAQVSRIIQTAMLSVGVSTGFVLLITYPFARWILSLLVPGEQLGLASSILPYALVSLWVTQITGSAQSGLDGTQRIDLKNVITIGTSLLYLGCALVLTPTYGLLGLAWANVIQAVSTLIGSWMLLRRSITELPPLPYQWSYPGFREMLGYALNFQLISVVKMLYDPVTKALLSRYGSLAAVGYYQMASRMVGQLRAFIVSANRAIVPVIADLQETEPEAIRRLYWDSYRLLFYVSIPLYLFIAAFSPAISEIWIGTYERSFVLFSALLVGGWAVNTLNGPAYFANLGTGDLRWNTISHVGIALLNAGLGVVLGSLCGASGVVIAWVCALAAGGIALIIAYHMQHGIRLREVVPKESVALLCTSLAGAVVAFLVHVQLGRVWNIALRVAGEVVVFGLIVIVPVWVHPMRSLMAGWITRVVFKARPEADSTR